MNTFFRFGSVISCFPLALSLMVPTAGAGMTVEHILAVSGKDAVIKNTTWDIVVARLEKVSTHAATNGNPPQITLKVEKVLRGEKDFDRTQAKWAPFPHDVDWTGEGAKERIHAWSVVPMETPKAKTRWILVGQIHQDVFYVSSLGRFPYSSIRIQEVLEGIEEGRRMREEFERLRKKEEEEKAAEFRSFHEQLYKEADLDRWVKQADFIGIGELVSGGWDQCNFQIHEILKGEKIREYLNDTYFTPHISLPKSWSDMLPRNTNLLICLDVIDPDPRKLLNYSLLNKKEGVLIHSLEIDEKIRELLAKK